MRRRSRRLLLLSSAVVLALLLGEVAARIALPLLPDPPGTAFVGDPSCGYLLRPTPPGAYPEDHDHHVNSLGFRDRNHPVGKRAGVRRILGLGDSFVYGAVVPTENFLRVAEAGLNAVAPTVEMILAGVPGWHTGNQAGWLASAGLELAPDLVMVNFFVGNDVTGLSIANRVIRGNLYPTTSPQPLRNLMRKSVLFQLFESQVWRPLRSSEGAVANPAGADTSAVNESFLYVMTQTLPVFRTDQSDRTVSLWTEAESYLTEIDTLCRTAGVPWLLVLIPDEIQVDPDVRRQVFERLGLDPGTYDLTRPQDRLKAFADRTGVPVLDLLPVLREAHGREGRQYVPNDTHWNARGNETAGEAVSAAITAGDF